MLVFASRSLPTVAALRAEISFAPPSLPLQIGPALAAQPSEDAFDPVHLDTASLQDWEKANGPIWPWQQLGSLEGVLGLRHPGRFQGASSSLGVAASVSRTANLSSSPDRGSGSGSGGGGTSAGTMRYEVAVGMVGSSYDPTPTEAAMRAALTAIPRRGFAQLRAENRAAWAELWEGGRVVAAGPNVTDEDQELLDVAFFYLHSGAHIATKDGVACYGLSQWSPLSGHIFWDQDSWMLPAVALTDPRAGRSLASYRVRTADAARDIARQFG